MTLKTTHGGPVFDGLHQMSCKSTVGYLSVVTGGKVYRGSSSMDDVLHHNLNKSDVTDKLEWTSLYRLAPMNLVKWSD